MTQLIGITGRAGSGKSTAADYLVSKGWTRVKMAGPLKAMLRAMGLTDRHIEGDLKNKPCHMLCGQTPRHAMITLGTEWGRDMIGQSLWTDLAHLNIANAMARGPVVVDDIRFENEADVIRKLGGKVLKIERASADMIDHKSEAGVIPDMTYCNDASIDHLRGYMDYVFLGALNADA